MSYHQSFWGSIKMLSTPVCTIARLSEYRVATFPKEISVIQRTAGLDKVKNYRTMMSWFAQAQNLLCKTYSLTQIKNVKLTENHFIKEKRTTFQLLVKPLTLSSVSLTAPNCFSASSAGRYCCFIAGVTPATVLLRHRPESKTAGLSIDMPHFVDLG